MDARLKALNDALNSVDNAGQAVAAADLCIGTLTAVKEQFSPYVSTVANWFTFGLYGVANADRADALSRISSAIVDVQKYRAPMAGNPAQPIVGGDPSWDDLFHAIVRAYNAMWAIESVQGDESEWQNFKDWAASTVAGSVQAMPGVIGSAVHVVSDTTTDLVGGVAGGLLPLWPLALAGGALLLVAVGGLAAARRLGVA